MIETTLQISDGQRRDFIRKTGTIPVDPVGYAWRKTFGEDAEIPRAIRCDTLMELNASRLLKSNRIGGSMSAKRYAKEQA